MVFGEPFPGSAEAAGSVLPGLQGPYDTPISLTEHCSDDLLCSLAPLHCEPLEEEAHVVCLYVSRAEPRLAHNMGNYLQMFISLVEGFAREF